MRMQTLSALVIVLLVVRDIRPGDAKRTLSRRRLRGKQAPRKTLVEIDSKIETKTGRKHDYKRKHRRKHQHQHQHQHRTVRTLDENFPPCNYYYPTRKSKFNKFDDDWYDPCKTEDSGHNYYRATGRPTYSRTDAPVYSPKTRFPSRFFSNNAPPVESSSTTSGNPWSDPILEIIATEIAPSPVASPSEPVSKPYPKPTPSPVSKPTKAPAPVESSEETTIEVEVKPTKPPVVSDETTIEVEVAGSGSKEEEASSCLAAQSGSVIPTSINFTIYYQYELLAERKANVTGVIWPEIDRAFQRFLAKELIECQAGEETGNTQPAFATRLKSISPQPNDSFGALHPTGWSSNNSLASNATSCSYLVLDEKLLADKELFCDVVTGSVTLYLSEVTYMNAASNPYKLFLRYSNDVIQFLREEINEGGKAITSYVDDGLGVRGFYFISDSPSSNLKPTSASTNGANGGTSSSIPAITASLAVFTVFAVATAGFVLHRKNRHTQELDDSLKQLKTPRTADDRDFYGPHEFYGLDRSDDECSIDDNLRERPIRNPKKIFFPSDGQTSECGLSKLSPSDLSAILDDLESPGEAESKYNGTRRNLSPILTGYNARYSRPDPSVDGSVPDPEPDAAQHPHDEFSLEYDDPQDVIELSTTSSAVSYDSSNTPLSSAPKASTIGSAALDYILSLGASILSPPQEYRDESGVSNGRKISTNRRISRTEESPKSHTAQMTNISLSSEGGVMDVGKQSRRRIVSPASSSINSQMNSSSISYKSPNSIMNWSMIKTPPSSSPAEQYSEYSRSRRQSLDNRARNYRSNLGHSPADSSWPASGGEFRKSLSSPHASPTDPILSEGTPSTARAAKLLSGSTRVMSDDARRNAGSERLPGKRRSRVSKGPRVRKKYTSLNDIENVLDREESLRVSSTMENDNDNQYVELFLSPETHQEKEAENFSPYGSETMPKRKRRVTPNTVML
eukprot:jgi/Psemu1/66106/estExt_Genemark1.C_1800069